MKVFITGGTGLLGSHLLRFAPKNYTLYANYHKNRLLPDLRSVRFIHLDITDAQKVKSVIEVIKPGYIIHTAAKSSPDFCENNPTEAKKINIEGTRNILRAGNNVGAKVIIMSSNHVFSGKNPPYTEDSVRDPVNIYGKTKVRNENDVLSGNYNATIVRLMTLYGWGNPSGQINTAMWVISMLSRKKEIKVVDDIFNNFLWVGDAAKYIWKIVTSRKNINLIQLAGSEIASRYEFAKKTAKVFNLNGDLISAVPKAYFNDEAPRPYNTIYDITYMQKILKIKPLNLLQGLSKMNKIHKYIQWRRL